jgi:hypothetical protein
MKLLSLSGGATKFAGLVSCAKGLIDSGFKPTHIVGVSAGALATLPIALGIEDLAIKIGNNIELKQLFSSLPVKDNGKLTLGAICRLLIGKKSLGVQKTDVLVKSIITEDIFNRYKSGDYAECYLLAVNFSSGGRELFRVKDLNYDQYLLAVSASSHIPMVSQPVEINGEFYFDGGIRDHNPGYYALTKIDAIFKEVVSIYSRPKIEESYDDNWKESFFNIFSRTIDIMNIEISKTDELLELEYCEKNNIKLKQLFLPKVLTSLFDTDKNRLLELSKKSYELGKLIV